MLSSCTSEILVPVSQRCLDSGSGISATASQTADRALLRIVWSARKDLNLLPRVRSPGSYPVERRADKFD